MPLPRTLDIPIPEWCSLHQSLFWIAYDEMPVERGLEFVTEGRGSIEDRRRVRQNDERMGRAKKVLQIAIVKRGLSAHGRLSVQPIVPENSWYLSRYHEHATEHTPIPSPDWNGDYCDFESQKIRCPRGEYIELRFNTHQLLIIFPGVESSTDSKEKQSQKPLVVKPSDAKAEYTTPYLELMHEAARVFRLSRNRQEKKDVLADWFHSQNVGGHPIPTYLAQAMATLVRVPEAQKGGNRKWQPVTTDDQPANE